MTNPAPGGHRVPRAAPMPLAPGRRSVQPSWWPCWWWRVAPARPGRAMVRRPRRRRRPEHAIPSPRRWPAAPTARSRCRRCRRRPPTSAVARSWSRSPGRDTLSPAQAKKVPTIVLNGRATTIDLASTGHVGDDGHGKAVESALVTGLREGANTIAAEDGGSTASLAVTNHPIDGPVFSGPRQTPFACTTAGGRAGPVHAPGLRRAHRRSRWDYVSTDGSIKPLPRSGDAPGRPGHGQGRHGGSARCRPSCGTRRVSSTARSTRSPSSSPT